MKWITRERARVDRIACPWLICRFIDPDAGVPLRSGEPGREIAAARERDPVRHAERRARSPRRRMLLRRVRRPVRAGGSRRSPRWRRSCRGADTDDRELTPESAGLYAAATGFQATSRDDFDNMARQFPMYDALYAYCRGASRGARAPPRVLFVCLHGAAKSVVGAARFRRSRRPEVSRWTRRRPAPSPTRSWRRGR